MKDSCSKNLYRFHHLFTGDNSSQSDFSRGQNSAAGHIRAKNSQENPTLSVVFGLC